MEPLTISKPVLCLAGYPFPELEILSGTNQPSFLSSTPILLIGWMGFFPHNGMQFLREAFLKVGGFDLDMAFSEGWDLAYRLQRARVSTPLCT